MKIKYQSTLTRLQTAAMSGDDNCSVRLAEGLLQNGVEPSIGDVDFCRARYPHKPKLIALLEKSLFEMQIKPENKNENPGKLKAKYL